MWLFLAHGYSFLPLFSLLCKNRDRLKLLQTEFWQFDLTRLGVAMNLTPPLPVPGTSCFYPFIFTKDLQDPRDWKRQWCWFFGDSFSQLVSTHNPNLPLTVGVGASSPLHFLILVLVPVLVPLLPPLCKAGHASRGSRAEKLPVIEGRFFMRL